MKDINFRPPVIKRYSKKWFVEYYYRCPTDLLQFGFKEWQRFKVYEDINRFKGEDKEKYAKLLCDATLFSLEKENYNPFDAIREKIRARLIREKELRAIQGNAGAILLTEAFDSFISAKQGKESTENTMTSYNSYINNFKHYLFENDKLNVMLFQFEVNDFKKMVDWLQATKKWSATTYNNHVAFIRTLINWFAMKPRKWVNPDDYTIGNEKEIEFKNAVVVKHQHFNSAVYDMVVERLSKFPKLIFYSKFIYYSCMRPEEIRNLQIEHIDLKARIIKIKGKTGYRVVPICDELNDMILALDIHKYPVNYYLMGKSGEVSDTKHGENYYSKYFRERVRNPLKLSENYTLYGWKHTRVINLINAGFKDAEIMQLTGHRDTDSYDAYKRDLMGNIDSKMQGKTISF